MKQKPDYSLIALVIIAIIAAYIGFIMLGTAQCNSVATTYQEAINTHYRPWIGCYHQSIYQDAEGNKHIVKIPFKIYEDTIE